MAPRLAQFRAAAQLQADQLARQYLRALHPATPPSTRDVMQLTVLLLSFAAQYHTGYPALKKGTKR